MISRSLVVAVAAGTAILFLLIQAQRLVERPDGSPGDESSSVADLERAKSALVNMNDAQLVAAGNRCIDGITADLTRGDPFSWDFLGIDPNEFSAVKSAAGIGLRLTALGSESAPPTLVASQVSWIKEMRLLSPSYALTCPPEVPSL